MKKLLLLVVLLSGFALAQNWEYAAFIISEETMGVGYRWVSDGIAVGPKSSLEALLVELGVAPGVTPLLTLFNYVGNDGWELTTMNTIGGSAYFMFKREKE